MCWNMSSSYKHIFDDALWLIYFPAFQNISGFQTEAKLVGLEPVSTYSISISAFTKVGNGNQFSNVLKFTTQESG